MSRTANRLLYKYKVVSKETNDDMDAMCREFNKEQAKQTDDGDSSDEFGVFDPAKHVSFDEKVKFSEQLKKCDRDKLTRIVEVLQKEQLDSVEELGQEKL